MNDISYIISKNIVSDLRLKMKENKKLKFLIIWLVLVFLLGSSMNLVEQASDPQFFIQVQFLFLFILFFTTIKIRIRYFVVFLIFDFFVVIKNHDCDKNKNYEIASVKYNLNNKKGLILADGFNGFIPLSKLEWNNNMNISYYCFPSDLQSDNYMSDSEYVRKTRDSINSFAEQGYKIIVVGFLNQSPKKLGLKFLGYDLTEKMKQTQIYLKTDFRIDTIHKGDQNPIFLLTPKPNE